VATWVEFLDDLATQADAIARRYFRTDLPVDRKADLSPVTQADREIEDLAARLLRERHPELGMLGEESGERGARETGRLIIDPIDGTRNFIRGIPIFATLLAIEIAGEVVAGLVSAPALGTRWHAVRGGGAFRDGRPIRVSAVADLDHALLFHANLGQAEPPPPPGFFDLVGDVERTRGFGDFYQHVLVAEGAGEVAVDPEAHPWDIAALQLIVEEAGGRATTLGGERSIYGGSLITSNGQLHGPVLSALGLRGLDGRAPQPATV
jgi:histidinol-phosphatase